MTQPHLLPICSDSGCICQGSPAIKPSPCCCIPPKHTPARATGLGHFLIFFRNYSSKVLHWKMLQNLDEKHTGWIFPITISPPSCPVLSSTPISLQIPPLYPHSSSPMLFPFTSLGYLLHKEVICSVCSKLEQLYLGRSISHTTGTPQQQMHKQDAGICAYTRTLKDTSGPGLNVTAQECQCFFENSLLVSYKVLAVSHCCT